MTVSKILIVFIFIISNTVLMAQKSAGKSWIELFMLQYNDEWFYTSSRVEPPNAVQRFVPFGGQSVFDHDPTTCWAEGVYGPGIGEEIWFSAPENPGQLDIINGYMKSERNFKMTNRVGKFSIRLYLGMYEPGRDINGERRFYLTPISDDQIEELRDDGKVQHFNIRYPYWLVNRRRKAATNTFIANWQGLKTPRAMTFVRIRILTVYPGTLYDDTSISEIAVRAANLDRLVLRVYAGESGDSLFAETPVDRRKLIDQEPGSIYLVQEVSPDKDWAIVLLLGDESSKANARYVLYYLPTATRFEAGQIDPDCDEISRFVENNNQTSLVYRNKNDISDQSIPLQKLLKKK